MKDITKNTENNGHLSNFSQTAGPFLPAKVAEVSRETLRTFPHTKRVGNYLLGRTVGEGSFAKVKEGLHTLTGEKVAVKVIDKKKAREDAYVRKNLRREGKLLQMVRHPHVVHLYEILETENSYYLVTELCRGGDLMDYICNRKRLDERETRRFIRQILSAVDYLHKVGILHRDLKVENLLLDENKNIKIIDFGLSNACRVTHTKEGSTFQEFCVTQCGSPAYAAPELLGNKKYGPKVDVWSIGVNMYAMLTGNLPFTVEPFNIKALYNKMLNGDMNAIPDQLSKNCKDLLKRFLTSDPEKRVSLHEAMHHPWIADGRDRQSEHVPFPNRLLQEDLDNNILKHMANSMDFRLSEVIRLVTNNIPNSATSTYHLLTKKVAKFQAEMRVRGKVNAADARAAAREDQDNGGSIRVTTGQVIELLPISDNNNTSGPDHRPIPPGNNFHSPEPKVIELNVTPRKLPRTATSPRRLNRRQDRHGRMARPLAETGTTARPLAETGTPRRPITPRQPSLDQGSDSIEDGPDAEDVQLIKLPSEGYKKMSMVERPYSPGGRLTTMMSTRSRSLSDKDDSFSSTELPVIARKQLNAHDCDGSSSDREGKDERTNSNLPSPVPPDYQETDRRTAHKQWPNLPGKLPERAATSSQSTVSSGRRSAVSGMNAKNGSTPSTGEKTVDERNNISDRSPTLERRNSVNRGGKKMTVETNHYDRFARRTGRGHTAGSHERKASPNRRLINLAYPEPRNNAGKHHSPTRLSPRLKRRGSMEPKEPDPSMLSVNGEKSELRNDVRPVTRGINRRSSFDHHQGAGFRRANTTLDEKVLEVPADRRSPLPPSERSAHSMNHNRESIVALPAISPPLIGARKPLDG